MARFLVRKTFSIPSRSLFVTAGEVVQGAVEVGQVVRAPLGLDALVEGVESVLYSAADGRSDVALIFRYSDANHLARWEALGLTGQTIELERGERAEQLPR
jgi:hypothetical protein